MPSSAGRQGLLAPPIGRYALYALKREEKRLAAGWRYEPRGFCEKNAAALAGERSTRVAGRKRNVPLAAPAGKQTLPAYAREPVTLRSHDI